MITFYRFGNYGRNGNMMFQYAAGLNIAKLRGTTFFTPYWPGIDIFNLDKDYKYTKNPLYKIKYYGIIKRFLSIYKYKEPTINYDNNFFKIKNGTDILGYFQSQKYFYNNEDLIKKSFIIKDKQIHQLIKNISAYNNLENKVGIHVRLGDYRKKYKIHPIQSKEYYKQAINMFINKGMNNFIIFSDELKLAVKYLKQDLSFNFSLLSLTDEMFKNLNEIKNRINNIDSWLDMLAMMNCKGLIIANSSYSWWAAYLKKKKGIVIAPSQWFGEFIGGFQKWRDIYIDNWIII